MSLSSENIIKENFRICKIAPCYSNCTLPKRIFWRSELITNSINLICLPMTSYTGMSTRFHCKFCFGYHLVSGLKLAETQVSLGLVALGIWVSAGGQWAETFHTKPEWVCNAVLESSLPINISLQVRQKLDRCEATSDKKQINSCLTCTWCFMILPRFRFPGSNVPKAWEVMWFQRHKLSLVYITEKPSHPGVTTLKVSVNPNLISCVCNSCWEH